MTKSLIHLAGLACICTLSATALLAEEKPGITASAAVQTLYGWDANAAPSNLNPSLGFYQQTNSLLLGEATATIHAAWTRGGFHIDAGYGDFYKNAMASDTVKGLNSYVGQAYAFYKPFESAPIRVEAGKFFSSVGAEVPHSWDDADFHNSRSLLFWYGSPLYHVGVRSTVQINAALSVGAQMLSGSNTLTGSHGHQSLGLTAAYQKKKFTLTQVYIGGNQKLEGRGWRQTSDTVVSLTPAKTLTGYIELLGVTEKRITPGSDRWYGAATAWRLSPIPKWSFSPRVEYFADPHGATTGTAQHLAEFTGGVEYRLNKHLLARLEYRNDWSTRPFYQASNGSTDRKQTLLAGITFLLEREL